MARYHPLQRLASPSRSASLAVHAVGVACFAAQFRFLFSIVTPLTGTFGGSYQYLTILGLAGATLTYALALVGDLTLSETVFRAKNVLSVCVTPLEVLISVLYCAIVAVNRDLLIPPQYRLDALPDFGFHGMPALLLVIDLLLFSPPWTIPAYAATALAGSLAVLYWFWIETCYSYNGFYPYPFIGMLSRQQRMLFFASTTPIYASSTVLLKWAYAKLNGREDFRREAINPTKTE